MEEVFGVAIGFGIIFGGAGYIVRIVVTERTKRLLASKETPTEVSERLSRIEARLGEMEAGQRQLQATQEWQQKLLEQSK
ncbi:MAG: hypothetical protein CL878_09730 [Dehalococcoidia bacterium]|nr:hypothetical protein [Dehalococcoidia bacterium]